MEGTTNIEVAKDIFGNNFFGLKELAMISKSMHIRTDSTEPSIPFKLDQLECLKETHLLILGVSWMADGNPLTIKSLRDLFGIDPAISEPCFYNQDWYLNEKFASYQLPNKWFLIGKNLIDKTRGEDPKVLIYKKKKFPLAVQCAYTFFVYWFYFHEPLWFSDYIWCRDVDNNGDQIYAGRYLDNNGINKNGFSIHRHLSIRKNYGCVGFY